MDAEIERSLAYAERLYDAAIGVMATAKVDIQGAWNRDPKIIALSILGRSLSSFKAALILVRLHQETSQREIDSLRRELHAA